MHHKTSSLYKLIEVFGEDKLIKAIEKAKKKQKPGSIRRITNPIILFLINTTEVINGKLVTRKVNGIPNSDYGYYKVATSLIGDLKSEILANNNYLKQVRAKILDSQQGPMLSALNEILAAGYLKSLGNDIALNSSTEIGAADVDFKNLPYATDAKLAPNNRLALEALVNDSAEVITNAVAHIKNQGLLIHVFKPEARLFRQSMNHLAEEFKSNPEAGDYSDDNLSATIIHNDYPGADFTIHSVPQNVNVFIQANWDLAPAIENLKASILKSVKQSKRLGKQAIPWIYVPRDANRHGIEVQALRFLGELHPFVTENQDIYVMPVFGFEFEGDNKTATIFDIYQTGQNTLGIDADSFQKYLSSLINREEFYV